MDEVRKEVNSFNEIALRDRAISLVVEYFKEKGLVTLDTFQAHWERVYAFLKNGKSE